MYKKKQSRLQEQTEVLLLHPQNILVDKECQFVAVA